MASKLQKSRALETTSCCTVPPPPPPLQRPLPVDPVDLRDWEDFGIDPDASDFPPHAYIDIALAALLAQPAHSFYAIQTLSSFKR